MRLHLAPVDTEAANDMVKQLRGARILGSFRGMRAADQHIIAQCLVTLSRLMHYFPEIQELDVNPLILSDDGKFGMALDARVICKNL